jgi:hypothetical protein
LEILVEIRAVVVCSPVWRSTCALRATVDNLRPT